MLTGASGSLGLHSRLVQKPRGTEFSCNSPRLPSGPGPVHEGTPLITTTSPVHTSKSALPCMRVLHYVGWRMAERVLCYNAFDTIQEHPQQNACDGEVQQQKVCEVKCAGLVHIG